VEIIMKWNLVLVVAALLAATSAFAQAPSDRPPPRDPRYDAPPSAENTKIAYADVLRVDPVYDRVQTNGGHEECEDVPVERHVDSGNNAAGTVIGAIVGGVLGNTVGKGDGRKAATVAGAVVGGAVGHNVASQDDRYYAGPERRCRMVQDGAEERRIVGYDVQYRYRGDVYMSRLDYDPGERVRVRVSVAPAD
jgi:uncharacterized protein YcfJ